jgi:hypothetical protein
VIHREVVYDCATGETREVVLTGRRLANHLAMLAEARRVERAVEERRHRLIESLDQAVATGDALEAARLLARALRLDPT